MTKPRASARSERWMEHLVSEAEAGKTVREILTGPMRVSRRMIQRLTRGAGIRVNRRPTHLSRGVRAGDVVAVRVASDEEVGLTPVPMPLRIVHEDADLLVIDKPPDLLVHPVRRHHTRTLAHGIAAHYLRQGLRARVRPVHRLDRGTSGLLVVAKTALAHQRLDRQMQRGTFRREYLALVAGVVEGEGGTIEAPIGAHPSDRNLRAVQESGDRALTRYRVVERYRDATLLELGLETGRTHQIRVHLAHRGHPLLSDRQYGGPEVPGLERPALHAWRLELRHPTGDEALEFRSELPEDLARVREKLRGRG